MADTYKIVRMYMRGKSRAVSGMGGLTLEQAQEYCHDPETSWKTCTKAAGKRRTAQMKPKCATTR